MGPKLQVESMTKLKNGVIFCLRKKGPNRPKPNILKESPPSITGLFLLHLVVGVAIAIGVEIPAGRTQRIQGSPNNFSIPIPTPTPIPI